MQQYVGCGKLDKNQLEHQIKLANNHLKIKGDSYTEKSYLNITQIFKACSKQCNAQLKRSVNTNSHLDKSTTSITQLISKYSKQATNPDPNWLHLNKRLDSCFL